MLNKKKGDRIPEEFVDDGYPNYPNVERWIKDQSLWGKHNRVYVAKRHFIIGEDDHRLYVEKTASTSIYPWIDGSVTLRRIHDGWLRGEFYDTDRFKKGEVTKHHLLVNILYKLTKVDDTIPIEWWNED